MGSLAEAPWKSPSLLTSAPPAADVLNGVLGRCAGRPVDIATAYFSISGYRLVREKLRRGAFDCCWAAIRRQARMSD